MRDAVLKLLLASELLANSHLLETCEEPLVAAYKQLREKWGQSIKLSIANGAITAEFTALEGKLRTSTSYATAQLSMTGGGKITCKGTSKVCGKLSCSVDSPREAMHKLESWTDKHAHKLGL